MATKRICPRCEGCDHDEPHHWMEDNCLTGLCCKHCPALGIECYACAGSGEGEEEDDSGVGHDGACRECGGAGIIEVQKVTTGVREAGPHVEVRYIVVDGDRVFSKGDRPVLFEYRVEAAMTAAILEPPDAEFVAVEGGLASWIDGKPESGPHG